MLKRSSFFSRNTNDELKKSLIALTGGLKYADSGVIIEGQASVLH